MDTKKILQILGKVINMETKELQSIPINTKLSDLGVTSIQFIQFIVSLEDEFQIEISDDDLIFSNFETIEVIYTTLEKYFLIKSTISKVLVCDCDNVLWHGISGEEDIYTDVLTDELQNEIIRLYERGTIICLCSKNYVENIDSAFKKLNMPLKKNYFLTERINLINKAENIKDIALELDLSLDSFVFIDDSDYELDLVSSILPEIKTIKVDYSKLDFIDKIRHCFDHLSTDMNRTKLYREQKQREKEKKHYNSIQDFNNSLNTVVTCELANTLQSQRISELSQRTNQFNLSNTRYTESEINNLIHDDNYSIYALSAKDKYGDMGIVGALIVHKKHRPVIISFFLSCRVFGREFEKILINKIKEVFPNGVSGVYNNNGKNERFKTFYLDNGIDICNQHICD